MTPEQLVEVTKKSSVEISGELSSFAAGCAKDSRQLCEFALENVLLHEAAAQQLQVGRGQGPSPGHCKGPYKDYTYTLRTSEKQRSSGLIGASLGLSSNSGP